MDQNTGRAADLIVGGEQGSNWTPLPRLVTHLWPVMDAFKQADDWLIVTHERPDGDAIGSALAMACVMDAMHKQWTFLIDEPMPFRFGFLPHFHEAQLTKNSPERKFQHVIAVDCADENRFLYAQPYIAADAVIVNVDHHQTNPRFGGAAWVDSEAAATCELVFHIVRALQIELTQDLAKCLYTGILTDTGGFAQPNTTRAVHQIAAELLASGVQPYDIAGPVLEARSWNQTRLLQLALNNLSVSDDGLYAALYVTRDMLDSTECTDDDSEGLVNHTRAVDTVEVGVLFRETLDGQVKASLRSKRCVDVALIAQKFDGGGHIRAAGCVLPLPLSEAMNAVYAEVKFGIQEAMPCIQAFLSSTSQLD